MMIEHGPFAVMAGAPWNVLDSRGARIALCGGDSNADWERFGPAIAAEIVKALNERAALEALRREVEKWRDEANELEDCREALRRLGHLCGCDHVASADERAMQEQHIEEAFARLRDERDSYRDRVHALEALVGQINNTLCVPAAEYVPAIGDVFTLIDESRAATP